MSKQNKNSQIHMFTIRNKRKGAEVEGRKKGTGMGGRDE